MKLRRLTACVMAAVTFAVFCTDNIAERASQAFSVEVEAATAITGGTVEYTVSGGKATITSFTSSSDSITYIDVPSNLGGYPVTAIGNNAVFGGNMSVTSINLPNTLTTVGESAFAMCSSLKSISIPSSVTKIGMKAFMSCSSLTDVSLPEGLTGMGNQLFYKCTSLQSVTVPSTVDAMGNSVFKGCKKLKKVDFKGNFPTYNGSEDPFDGCPSDLVITYVQGKTGWSSTWWGRTCVPYSGGGSTEPKTEATTQAPTTQVTTQATTKAPTTQATTQATTKAPATQASTQATTKAQPVTEKATETTTAQQGGGSQSYTPMKGDADADGKLTAADSTVILQKVLNKSYKMNIEYKTSDYLTYVDVDKDKTITAADSAIVLQKVLNSGFKW